ncbi:alpha/beta hydrolase [Enterococcus alishanensis]|uniref:Alpha/beta hydrolase n=1 Tax=Enterococcus alishanensis TaxID=1303817 RepID=A0ABS6TD96_9ENTE|nr:alpha/beta hydrolase [Enterococcus alishanensis]MBV7390888.1 alpha/beta hydrolase [Enterococcus alishanensis]
MKVMKNVVYHKDLNLKADIYQPETFERGLIDLHGGGWFRGSKEKEGAIAEKFAEAGFLVVVPDYRLAPENLFPAALEDTLASFDWAYEQYPELKGNWGAFGSSAGGNLSIELALQRGIPAVSWSGIIDIAKWVHQHADVVAENTQKPNFDQQASALIDQDGANDPFYKWFITNYAPDDQKLADATPLQRVSTKSGPLYLANSLREFVPLSGIYQLQKALADNNVPNEVKLIEGTRHAEGYLEAAWTSSLAFLKQYIKKNKA